MILKFTILGQCCSMKNSREIVKLGNVHRLIKSRAAREYERSTQLQIPPEARQMFTCRVRATVTLYYASERPDLDAELLFDCLAAKYKREKGKLQKTGDGNYRYAPGERVLVSKGVYVNDRLVREKHLHHRIDKVNPRAEIEIETMEPLQASSMEGLSDDEPEFEAEPF